MERRVPARTHKGFMAGKSRTSFMLVTLVSNMVKRSMPRPHPAVGGSPYSSASQNPSSGTCSISVSGFGFQGSGVA
jgi:hypothetical protein